MMYTRTTLKLFIAMPGECINREFVEVNVLITFHTRAGMGSAKSLPLKLDFDCVSVCCHSGIDAEGRKRRRKNTDDDDGTRQRWRRWGRWWRSGSRTSAKDSK